MQSGTSCGLVALDGVSVPVPAGFQRYQKPEVVALALETRALQMKMDICHLLCRVALYREYMAFLPFNVDKPIGPLDEPTFPASKFPPPPNYWENQARDCFKAARSLIDLLQACEQANVLVETPLSGFATWQVVICGMLVTAIIYQ